MKRSCYFRVTQAVLLPCHSGPASACSAAAGNDQGEEAASPSTTFHTPLEHQAKLRSMAVPANKLLEDTAGYMAGVRAQVCAHTSL